MVSKKTIYGRFLVFKKTINGRFMVFKKTIYGGYVVNRKQKRQGKDTEKSSWHDFCMKTV